MAAEAAASSEVAGMETAVDDKWQKIRKDAQSPEDRLAALKAKL